MIADRHTHCHFSEDSFEPAENNVRKALEMGMKDLYFTDHYDIDFPDGTFIFDPEAYFAELLPLKEKYADRIRIHIGVELGLKTTIGPKIDALLAKYPFEYKIGSIHLIDNKDPYDRKKFDMSDEAFYRRYFETMLACLKTCRGFDAFGHLDYVVRYGYGQDQTYSYRDNADVLDAVLTELIRQDIVLEINTAGLRKGLAFPHPYPDVLKRYRELGGRRLSFGSDAHEARYVGADFDRALEYVKTCGFAEKDII